MSQFQKGDVVRLKSGGERMTIEDLGNFSSMGVGPKEGAKCVWFDDRKVLREVFDIAVLEKAGSARPGAGAVQL